MKRISVPCILLLLFPVILSAQVHPKDKGLKTITENSIQGPLEFLASDWMTGRETGTRGEFIAADYIASVYKTIGLKPGGNTSRFHPSYFQNINFIQTRPGERQECSILKKGIDYRYQINLVYKTDYAITPGSQSVETEAQVVFAGYGIEDKSLNHNDFKSLDVKGKILIRLAGYPGWMDPDSKNFKRFTSADPLAMRQIELNKDVSALARGAVAIIEIRGGSTGFAPSPGNLPFRYNEASYEGDEPFSREIRYRTSLQGTQVKGLAKILLSDRALQYLLEGSNIDVANYENQAASKNLKPTRMPSDRYLRFSSTIDSRVVRGRNVIGILEGTEKEKCIVVGAHYDHIGQTRGFIFNGSDDNASGTVGVIAIANAMLSTGVKPKVTVVFCAWTAEEKGLLGSAYYVNHPVIKDIRCYMNYDMISRTAPDDSTGLACDFNYSSGSPFLKDITDKHLREYDIRLDLKYAASPRPSGGSDFSSFSRKDIPIFLIHGKFTPDYHHYTDHSEKAVLPYMTEIVKLGYLNIYELANRNWQ